MRYIDKMPPTPTGNTNLDMARLTDYLRTLVEQLNYIIAKANKKNGGS